MKTFQQFLQDIQLVESPSTSVNPGLASRLQRITGPGVSDTQIPRNRPNVGTTAPLGVYRPNVSASRGGRIGVYTPPPPNTYTQSSRGGGTETTRIPQRDIKKVTPRDLANPLNPRNLIPRNIPFS